jgi:hypothetical protein
MLFTYSFFVFIKSQNFAILQFSSHELTSLIGRTANSFISNVAYTLTSTIIQKLKTFFSQSAVCQTTQFGVPPTICGTSCFFQTTHINSTPAMTNEKSNLLFPGFSTGKTRNNGCQ